MASDAGSEPLRGIPLPTVPESMMRSATQQDIEPVLSLGARRRWPVPSVPTRARG